MRMVAEREQAVYASTGMHLRGMAETSVEKAESELNAEALKWKRDECEIFEAEKKAIDARSDAGLALMENEAKHLHAERAQLQEQSAVFRDECASLRFVSDS